MLQPETLNRQAFDLYTMAKRRVSRYERTLNAVELDEAIKNLDSAINADSNFFKPANFKGIIYDLKGQSDEAIRQFDSILDQSPASLKDEVEYNKAVAKYHCYGESFIKEAIDILEGLDRRLQPNGRLSLLVKAVLSQSYAMMVFHSRRSNNEKDVVLFSNNAEEKANEALRLANELSLSESFLKQPRWIANNAKGISLMFLDDNVRDNIKKEESKPYMQRLKKSIEYFDKAADYSPNNWALECNKASSRMRMGHLLVILGESEKAKKIFEEAISLLNNVISKLRPNYGFAIYELGRINRFQKNFTLAEKHFQVALAIPEANRNVGDKTLKRELEANTQRSTMFKFSV
jgi:tetratricopeptide (TPR) repeat protein